MNITCGPGASTGTAAYHQQAEKTSAVRIPVTRLRASCMIEVAAQGNMMHLGIGAAIDAVIARPLSHILLNLCSRLSPTPSGRPKKAL